MAIDDGAAVTANDLLWDRLIVDSDGFALGKVDDFELSPGDGSPPAVTALLCGPMALGPRIGGRLGGWWATIGKRLRLDGDAEPVRVPSSEAPGDRNRRWMREHIVERIPGGRR